MKTKRLIFYFAAYNISSRLLLNGFFDAVNLGEMKFERRRWYDWIVRI